MESAVDKNSHIHDFLLNLILRLLSGYLKWQSTQGSILYHMSLSTSNPQAGLGLADEDQRAVAIPRGDCKLQQHHPSARIFSYKPDEV